MSVSRNLKLFAGLTAAVALFAGCGGGDNNDPLELKPVVSGSSSTESTIQTPATAAVIEQAVVNKVLVADPAALPDGFATSDYAVTTTVSESTGLATGDITIPVVPAQSAVAIITGNDILAGGSTPIVDPVADVYLVNDSEELNLEALNLDLSGRAGRYRPILSIPDVRAFVMALRPGLYVLSMRNVPFYPGLTAQRGMVVFRVVKHTGLTTFPTKITMALPSYGQVMGSGSWIRIETDNEAQATRAGFFLKHANGEVIRTAPVANGTSQVYGDDGGATLGNPISLITAWCLE